MRQTTLTILGLLLLVGFSGCAGPRMDAGRPEPPTLGPDIRPTMPSPNPRSPVPPSTRLAEPGGSLALRQALALALMNNPELAVFSWEVREREARMIQAGLLPNPELEVEVENFGGTGAFRSFDGSETTVQISQLIEMAGKRSKRKRVSAFERDLAGWDYEIERIHVLAETSKAFVDVLAAQERKALNEELVRLAEQVLEIVSERIRAGKVSPVEETRARVSLVSRRIEAERVREELTALRKVLAATWGGTLPTFQEVEGKLDRLPPVPPIEVLAGRISNNPEMARWMVEIENRRASFGMEKAMRVPDLTLSGGVRRLNETGDTAFVLGLSVPIPVFDRNQGGAIAARYGLVKAEEELRASQMRIQKALALVYQRLSSASNEAASLKNELLPGARRAFEATGEGYRSGKFGYLDVLEAQQTFFEVNTRYIEALSDFHKAVADMERLTGEPLDEVEETCMRRP